MYRFLATRRDDHNNPDPRDPNPETREYGVCESTYDAHSFGIGDLIYGDSIWRSGHYTTGAVELPRCGYRVGNPVTPEDAVLITGVDHPMAALDRLREWVYAGYAVS